MHDASDSVMCDILAKMLLEGILPPQKGEEIFQLVQIIISCYIKAVNIVIIIAIIVLIIVNVVIKVVIIPRNRK